jgi:hypothetical protein
VLTGSAAVVRQPPRVEAELNVLGTLAALARWARGAVAIWLASVVRMHQTIACRQGDDDFTINMAGSSLALHALHVAGRAGLLARATDVPVAIQHGTAHDDLCSHAENGDACLPSLTGS